MNSRIHLLAGLVVWVLFAAAWRPAPQDPRWIVVLLLFSPLVLMPLASSGLRARRLTQPLRLYEVPAAALLAPAFAFPADVSAAIAASAWLLLCTAQAHHAIQHWRLRTDRGPAALAAASARVFPAVGAVWLVADRLGWQPLGFDRLVVLLTAAHFHHAGFSLPLIAGLNGKEAHRAVAWIVCGLVLAGVPLVAAGITLTHLAGWRHLEPWAVAVLVAGALLTATLQLSRATEVRLPGPIRWGMALSGIALAAAMVLALSYGFRFLWPSLALPLPLMWAIHGSLNVFGFGLLGILSWRALLDRSTAADSPSTAVAFHSSP
jgi:hypothetical protein